MNETTPAARESVLTEAQRMVHGARNEDYKHPLDAWDQIAAMWSVILKRRTTAEEALQCMVAMKLVRETVKPKRDNRVDGAGYFECLDWVRDERERRERDAKTKPAPELVSRAPEFKPQKYWPYGDNVAADTQSSYAQDRAA